MTSADYLYYLYTIGYNPRGGNQDVLPVENISGPTSEISVAHARSSGLVTRDLTSTIIDQPFGSVPSGNSATPGKAALREFFGYGPTEFSGPQTAPLDSTQSYYLKTGGPTPAAQTGPDSSLLILPPGEIVELWLTNNGHTISALAGPTLGLALFLVPVAFANFPPSTVLAAPFPTDLSTATPPQVGPTTRLGGVSRRCDILNAGNYDSATGILYKGSTSGRPGGGLLLGGGSFSAGVGIGANTAFIDFRPTAMITDTPGGGKLDSLSVTVPSYVSLQVVITGGATSLLDSGFSVRIKQLTSKESS